MADFKLAWAKTSKHEGGYVNNSVDRGKETYRGIASAFHPTWEGWPVVRKTIVDIGIVDTLDAPKVIRQKIDKALAAVPGLEEMVERFYKIEFWDKLGLDVEKSQLIADEVFDTAVNMGVGAAQQMIKEARANV
jgi:lysozyme family protein